MDAFLTHAQIKMTDALNAYAQDANDADGVDGTRAAELGIDGRMFKKVVGSAITAAPTQFDVISFNHKNTDINNSAVGRFIGYSNVGDNPQIKPMIKSLCQSIYNSDE